MRCSRSAEGSFNEIRSTSSTLIKFFNINRISVVTISASHSSTSLSSFDLAAIGSHENSPKLPIHGDVEDEITLGLNFPEGNNNLFKLNGKLLQLVHPLDRDKENLSHIQFTVSCSKLLSWRPSGASEFIIFSYFQ